MMRGWLWIDGTEVLNDSRLMANLPCRIGDVVFTVGDDDCPGLMDDPTTGSPLSVGTTANPWYDAAYPESEEFYGFWVMEASLNSTVAREASARGIARGGSNLSRPQRKHREMAFEIAFVGESEAALRYGYDWLASRFDPVDPCDLATALVRLSCPEDSYLDGLWELREVGIIDPLKWADTPLRRAGCVIRRASFTLAAGDPWRYSTTEDTEVDAQTMSLNDDCAGSGDSSQSNQHDYLCPDELPDQRVTATIAGPGPFGQIDVGVLIDGTVEGAAAMRVRSRLPTSDESPVFPDPDTTFLLFETWAGTDVPIGAGSFTTDDPIQPTAYAAVAVVAWFHAGDASALTSRAVPEISGGGCTNWKCLGIGIPQTSPSTEKGFYAFVGQAGATPVSEAITITMDPAVAWGGNILVHEATDVLIGDDPRDCLRQWVIDKKNADNFGGDGQDGSSPVGAKVWQPLRVDHTADSNHLLLACSFHAGSPTSCTVNEGGGWTATVPDIQHALSSADGSWFASKKNGRAVGENYPMFNWQTNLISSGGIVFEFIPRVPDRTHRWPATVHWISDKQISSGASSVGQWPPALEFNIVDDTTGWLLIYFISCQQGTAHPAIADLQSAGFELVDNSERANAGGTPALGEQHAVLWKRPSPGEANPGFPYALAGNHHTIGGVMLRNVKAVGDPINVALAAGASDVKDTASTSCSIPGISPTVDECIAFFFASRGADANSTEWANGPVNEYSNILAPGAAAILREADPTDVEGNVGEDAGHNQAGEITAGTTGGNGGGILVVGAVIPTAGASGAVTADIATSTEEIYTSFAVEGEAAEEAAAVEYLTEAVTCRLAAGERIWIDSSESRLLFDNGDETWRDGSAKVRTASGESPFISVFGDDELVVEVEPANLMGHTDESAITILTRLKVGV